MRQKGKEMHMGRRDGGRYVEKEGGVKRETERYVKRDKKIERGNKKERDGRKKKGEKYKETAENKKMKRGI